jgi:hypothetical protein
LWDFLPLDFLERLERLDFLLDFLEDLERLERLDFLWDLRDFFKAFKARLAFFKDLLKERVLMDLRPCFLIDFFNERLNLVTLFLALLNECDLRECLAISILNINKEKYFFFY